MTLEHAELPEELVRAQREGSLVLFVGAGVSRAWPSCLPLFVDLARRVAQRFEVPFKCSDSPEKILGDLKREGFNVHREVRDIILGSERPNAAHEAVAALSEVGRSMRVVTTNYDRHLSLCLPYETQTYDAPSLPEPLDFDGVVHLHGSVAQDPDQLVVTNLDLGRAYMTSNSSTLRFLQQLLASHTVLFIGYSLRDPLMPYILRGNAPKDRGSLFVLTDDPDRPYWNALGVRPVKCSQDDQPVALQEWAQRVGTDFEEHDRRVAKILCRFAYGENLASWEKSYLSQVVSDSDLVHVFTKNARGPVLFRWLATRPGMRWLFTPQGELRFVEKELVGWFASHYNDDDETAAEVVRLVVENGGRLHEMLWLNMAMRLIRRPGGSPERTGNLMLVLANCAPPNLDNVLLGLLKECDIPRDDDLFLELVDRAFRPKIAGPDPMRLTSLLPGAFHTESNTPADDWLRGSPERVFWATRRHLAADLLSIVDGHLRRVHRIEEIAGNPDPFADRAAIEPHDQNSAVRSTDFLVDAARDLCAVLAEDLPETAAGYLRSWAASKSVVLNRLSIHGWSERRDVSADKKIEWLLQQDEWIHEHRMHHETMQLIAKTVPNATESTIGRLIERIVGASPESRRTFDQLGWIAHHARYSSKARQAFKQAKRDNPSWEMSDHPEFLTWIEDGTETPLPQYLEGVCPRDLAARLMSDTKGAAGQLVAIAKPTEPQGRDSQRLVRTVRKAIEICPSAGLALLETLVEQPSIDDQAQRLLASAVLIELLKQAKARETTWEHRSRIGRLLPDLWKAGVAHWGLPSPTSPSVGCPREQGNLWPSLLIRLAIETGNIQTETDPQSHSGLSAHDKRFLGEAIGGDSEEATLAQVTCANRLLFLYTEDRQWTTRHILPLLDPTLDAERALRCWDSYLHQQPWPPSLPGNTLFTHFRAFAQHAGRSCEETQQQYGMLAAYLCITNVKSPDTPPEWLNGFTGKASGAIRVHFIRSTTRMLYRSDPEIVAGQWRRWMRHYWQERLDNYPRDVTVQEKTALADWVMLAGDDYPEAVNLVLSSPTAFREGSFLPNEMFQASLPRRGLQGSEPEYPSPLANQAVQHPEATTQLIAHLLEHTDQRTAQQWDIRMGRFIKGLQTRRDRPAFRPLRKQLLRLGWYYMISD